MSEIETEPTPRRRVVAIVGRPNVGKSALFNRLVGRRMAIVHEQSGVTRDRLAAMADWGGHRFQVIDTGGLSNMDGSQPDDAISAGMAGQVAVALQDAAAVLFVVDATAGELPLDREVARLLHQTGTPVLLAANKADNQKLAAASAEFDELGFPVFPVSALHGRGVDELVEAAVTKLPPPSEEAEAEALKIAVLGRPNVGKSSYINAMLKNERVIVSDVPGTTRDSIEVPFVVGEGEEARHYVLIDTAGIRRLGKVDTVVERFSLFRTDTSISKADVVVLMIDAQEGPTAQDKKIATKIMQKEKGCVVFVNKWDLALGRNISEAEYTEAFYRTVPFLRFAPVLYISARNGYNLGRSIESIDYVASQVRTKLTTGTLNRVLKDATQRVQPPLVGRHRLKIYYATQTGTQPVRVTLFVNNPKKITPAYRSYLQSSLRKAFGLEGAPLVLLLRRSHEPRGAS